MTFIINITQIKSVLIHSKSKIIFKILQLQAFDYTPGDGIMVNATEMAKVFGKRPAKWLELPSTKNFLNHLVVVRKSDSVDNLIITEHGGFGGGGGTWIHEDAAMEFARWLSPAFAIWCNDRIKELITTGKIELFKPITRVEMTKPFW